MNLSTKHVRGLAVAAAGFGSLLLFSIAGCNGCNSSSSTAAPAADGSTTSASASDTAAADGNLAPVSGQPTQVLGQSSSYSPQQQSESYPQQEPAPIEQGNPSYNAIDQSVAPAGDDNDASGIQADQPPPPLPDYDQPPAPEDDYLWTPGYWGYANSGYYWVPGVWCPPPYYGALWTPPYWGYYGGHYGFHHGYWGPHIGFYGGIDYGFGYIGIGFFGGYWQGHNFYYNRAVTNVNVNIVHNVYNREVVYNNVHYGKGIQNRVSYNGGRGGLNVAPRPQEIAALHETHTPALHEQVQVRTLAASNRAQFYAQNHGKPAQVALARPMAVSHQIADPPHAVQQEQQRSAEIQRHNVQTQHAAAPAEQRGAEPLHERLSRSALPNPQRGPRNPNVLPSRSRGPQHNRSGMLNQCAQCLRPNRSVLLRRAALSPSHNRHARSRRWPVLSRNSKRAPRLGLLSQRHDPSRSAPLRRLHLVRQRLHLAPHRRLVLHRRHTPRRLTKADGPRRADSE
jgi:hypothetical protein